MGITAILGSEYEAEVSSDEVEFSDPVERMQQLVPDLRDQGCDFIVLLAHASVGESARIAASVDGSTLWLQRRLRRTDSASRAHPRLVCRDGSGGVKGMYGGIIGLLMIQSNLSATRSSRFRRSSRFASNAGTLCSLSEAIEDSGFSGLGLMPAAHPTGRQFVGSEACADCHTKLMKSGRILLMLMRPIRLWRPTTIEAEFRGILIQSVLVATL